MADEQVGQEQAPAQTPNPAGGAPKTGNEQQQQARTDQQPQAGRENAGAQDDARSKGLLNDLRAERQARQRLEAELNQTKGAVTAAQRQIQALTGVLPKNEADQEIETVREKLVKAFPVLGKLTDEKLDQILGIAEQGTALSEATSHHWTNHGRVMLDSLTSKLEDAVGGTLTERQAKKIKEAYVREAENNPDFLARHERGDQKLIEEFVKEWIEDWFEPARRNVLNQEVNRQRRVPDGKGRRDVTGGAPKKIDYKNDKAVEDAMVESFRQNGGQFGS